METTKKTKEMDMLNGGLAGKLILFSIPLAFSSILQQLFNSADVAVVGRFAGSAALAAVGGNSPVINLLINMFVGLSIGANVIIANFIGQGREDKVKEAVHTVMSVALISGVSLLVIGSKTNSLNDKYTIRSYKSCSTIFKNLFFRNAICHGL